MAIIWAGNELDAFDRASPLESISSNTTAGARDSNYCPTGALGIAGNALCEIDFPAVTELWFHCEFYHTNISVSSIYPCIMFMDASTGQVAFQFDGDGSTTTWGMEYWNGAAFTEVASDDTLASNTRYVFDIYIKIANSGGIVRYYRGGVLKGEFVGDTLNAGFTSISRLILGQAGGGTTVYSQMILADQSTIGMHVSTLNPSAAGTTTSWTGAYTDIDDVVIDGSRPTGTLTYINTGSAATRMTVNVSNPTAAAALLNPLAVIATARARAHGTAPNLSVGLYTSGSFHNGGGSWTDGSTSVYRTLTQSLQGVWCIYHREPVLDTRWTAALINSLEWAVETQ